MDNNAGGAFSPFDVIFDPSCFFGRAVTVAGTVALIDESLGRMDITGCGAKLICEMTQADSVRGGVLAVAANVRVTGAVKKAERRTYLEASHVEVIAAATAAAASTATTAGPPTEAAALSPPETASAARAGAVTMSKAANADSASARDANKRADDCADSGDDDYDADGAMFSLFLDENYKELTYGIGGLVHRVMGLTAASTEYDRTGQIVWPVSVFLAWFVTSRVARPWIAGRTVVELGCGTALAGVAAARLSAHTALTDGSDVVLRMLARTASLNQDELGAQRLSVHSLLWGDRENHERFCAALGERQADVVIGADVVCWPASVRPLLTTVKALLRGSSATDPAPVFFCGFVCRAHNIRAVLLETAVSLGFEVSRIPDAEFLPSPAPSNVHSDRELELLKLELKRSGSGAADDDVEWVDGDADAGAAC
eukprot:g2360.t1